jgi:hypothetical protein
MGLVVLVVAAVAFDRLLTSARWRGLAPAQRRWSVLRPRVIAAVRSAPATFGYLGILVVTSWVLVTASGRLADRLLLEQSTTLHPVRVLISSAFWLSGTGSLALWAVLLALVLAPVERRVGSWRMTVVFALGHLGATLLTAAGLWVALRLDAVERSVVNAQDVGASYGFLAVAGVLTYLLEPRVRRPYALGLLLGMAGGAALFHTFTDFGHLLALLIGFACYPLVRGRSRLPLVSVPLLRRRGVPDRERAQHLPQQQPLPAQRRG